MNGVLAAFLTTLLILPPTALGQQPEPCPCPDLNGVTGEWAGQAGGRAVQCAYADGACVWDDGGVLLNTEQTNCQRYIAPYFCPATDATGQGPGVLINTIIPYQCIYYEADETDIICSWNAIGQSLYDEPYCDGLTVEPCILQYQ